MCRAFSHDVEQLDAGTYNLRKKADTFDINAYNAARSKHRVMKRPS